MLGRSRMTRNVACHKGGALSLACATPAGMSSASCVLSRAVLFLELLLLLLALPLHVVKDCLCAPSDGRSESHLFCGCILGDRGQLGRVRSRCMYQPMARQC